MLRRFETEPHVRARDQHNLTGEVFSYERYGTPPLFSQELEEKALGHECSSCLGGNRSTGGLSALYILSRSDQLGQVRLQPTEYLIFPATDRMRWSKLVDSIIIWLRTHLDPGTRPTLRRTDGQK